MVLRWLGKNNWTDWRNGDKNGWTDWRTTTDWNDYWTNYYRRNGDKMTGPTGLTLEKRRQNAWTDYYWTNYRRNGDKIMTGPTGVMTTIIIIIWTDYWTDTGEIAPDEGLPFL